MGTPLRPSTACERAAKTTRYARHAHAHDITSTTNAPAVVHALHRSFTNGVRAPQLVHLQTRRCQVLPQLHDFLLGFIPLTCELAHHRAERHKLFVLRPRQSWMR